MQEKSRYWLHWAVAMILGCVIGFAIASWIRPHLGLKPCFGKSDKAGCIADHLSRKLRLSEVQRTRVEEIFRSHEKGLKDAHAECHTRFAAVRAQINGELEKILDSEQRRKLKLVQEELDKQRSSPSPIGN